MLEDNQIKLIMNSLDKDFKKEEEKYKNTKKAIQELCNHNELVDIMCGRKCTICGKIFSYTRKLEGYVKRDSLKDSKNTYVEADTEEVKQATDKCTKKHEKLLRKLGNE